MQNAIAARRTDKEDANALKNKKRGYMMFSRLVTKALGMKNGVGDAILKAGAARDMEKSLAAAAPKITATLIGFIEATLEKLKKSATASAVEQVADELFVSLAGQSDWSVMKGLYFRALAEAIPNATSPKTHDFGYLFMAGDIKGLESALKRAEPLFVKAMVESYKPHGAAKPAAKKPAAKTASKPVGRTGRAAPKPAAKPAAKTGTRRTVTL